jgi:predicted RNA binding protein YcfA (HicA-like mRNA interferase family)
MRYTKYLKIALNCILSFFMPGILSAILKENGWTLDRVKGSYHIYVKPGKRSIPVPIHGSKDLPKGLIKAILKQAEIPRR